MSRWLGAWCGRQGLAAVAVIALMVVVRGRLLAGSYFNQDDFYMMGRAYESDLTWEYLLRDFAGHVNPLQQLSLWLVAHHAPYQWPVLVTAILAVNTAAVVVVWLILSRLLPGRWSRVVLLAVFAWAPLTLVSTLWWSASMFLWPHVLCSLVAVWLLVRWRQGGRPVVHLLAISGVVVIGLLWHERSVLIPPLLLGAAVALADEARGWRRLPAAARRFAWLWGALVALLGGFLVAHARLTEVEGGGGSLRQMLGVAWSFLGRNAVPGLVGGPWAGELDGGAVRPATWVTVTSLALVAALVALLLWRGGPSRRWALAALGGYAAADAVLLLSGRAAFGPVIGLDPRYSADILHAAVVCAALALRGGPAWLGFDALRRRRRGPVAVAALLAAYGAASVSGTMLQVPHFQNTADRGFVTHLREGLAADPTQVIFDDLAPAELVLPLVGDDSRYAHIFGPLPERPAFDQPSPHLRVLDDEGRLHPVVLDGSVPAVPGPDGACGHALRGTSTTLVRFRLPLEGRLAVRLRYFSAEESTVTVDVDDWDTEFLARRGPNEVWLVLPDLPGLVESLELRGDGRSTVCVTDVDAGLPERP